ncbi:MAG: hypothetical protein HY831_01345 [Candidatus Aenigmarchaeota archaeon]|nr:hypothetical protein [Candidatus Aenigmarchaeota archaeon]
MKLGSILTLIGGLLITLNATLASLAYSTGITPVIPMFMSSSLLLSFSLIGLLAGILVLLGFYLSLKARNSLTAGVLIIMFSVVGFVGGGGFFVGSILGIIGGAFILKGR